MYVSPAQLLFSVTYGASQPSAAETAFYETLSAGLAGTFDPFAADSLTATLLDLSASEPSGLTMFDVLAESYGLASSSFDLLSVYSGDW